MVRPPRGFTVFPYTTLFRSDRSVERQLLHERSDRALPRRPGRHPLGDHREDRKSTSLNSSHVEISYAVFCLKKKKTVIPYRLGDNVARPLLPGRLGSYISMI